MSAEGEANLDNDGAGDVLSSFGRNLFARIETLITHPAGHEYDDGYISELFALIEVAFALEEKNILYHAPNPKEFCGLLGPFQQRWRDYHRSAGHEPPAERDRTMRKTFQRLAEICHSLGKDDEAFGGEIEERELAPEDIELERQLRKIFGELQQ